MAETLVERNNENEELEHSNSWDGGKSPFDTSYGKIMIWYFLLSDAFTFAGFLITYGTLRFASDVWPVPDYVFKTFPFLSSENNYPLFFVTIMSFVLIISSVTMVRAVQEGHRENKSGVLKWMIATIVGGAIFLGCQAWEWTNLIGTEGMTIHTDPFGTHTEAGTYLTADELKAEAAKLGYTIQDDGHGGVHYTDSEGTEYWAKRTHHGDLPANKRSFEKGSSYLITYHHGTYENGAYKTADGRIKAESFGPKAFGALFFFITGFHGFHVFSGLLFLAIIAINVASGLYVERKNGYEMVEKVGLYWHFVDLVWVFVFLAFYLL